MSNAAKKIFISYRREDSQHQTGRIYDRLAQEFDADNVFYDESSIPLGVEWQTTIERRLAQTDVMICPIGDHWIDGFSRLDGEDILVFEIELALSRKIPIVPLLVARQKMPSKEELPPRIAALLGMNGVAVRPGRDFHKDMDQVVAAIRSSQRASSAMQRAALKVEHEQLMKLLEWGWCSDVLLREKIQSILSNMLNDSVSAGAKIPQ